MLLWGCALSILGASRAFAWDGEAPTVAPRKPKLTPAERKAECRYVQSELRVLEREHDKTFAECTDLKKRIAQQKRDLAVRRQNRRRSERDVRAAERIVKRLEQAKAQGKTGTEIQGMGLRDARAHLKERKRVFAIDLDVESAMERGLEQLQAGLKKCLERLKFLKKEIVPLRTRRRQLACS